MINLIKSKLKQNNLVYRLNAFIKTKLQELKITNEYSYYNKIALKNKIKVPNQNELIELLKNRFKQKGMQIIPKSKGDLNIYLIYNLNNWEKVLLKTLRLFGTVTEFELGSYGYQKSTKWNKTKD